MAPTKVQTSRSKLVHDGDLNGVIRIFVGFPECTCSNIDNFDVHVTIWVRILTNIFVLKYSGVAPVWVLASQLPDVKERLPVNVRDQPIQIIIPEYGSSQPSWLNCDKKQRALCHIIIVSAFSLHMCGKFDIMRGCH